MVISSGKKIDTVILAGGRNHRFPFQEEKKPSCKALLPFRDKPSIQYVLDALQRLPRIGRMAIVGPREQLRAAIQNPADYTFLPGGEWPGESAFQGLRHFRESVEVLFVTADIPLVTTASVAAFLEGCFEKRGRGDIFVSAVDRSKFTGAYEECPKTCTRFRGRSVCHGNLVLVDPSRVLDTVSEEQLNTIYRARKNPLRTASAFGWRFILAYLLGGGVLRFFTLEQSVKAASKQFRLSFVPIFLDFPEIAVDIDEPADYEFVRRQIYKQ